MVPRNNPHRDKELERFKSSSSADVNFGAQGQTPRLVMPNPVSLDPTIPTVQGTPTTKRLGEQVLVLGYDPIPTESVLGLSGVQLGYGNQPPYLRLQDRPTLPDQNTHYLYSGSTYRYSRPSDTEAESAVTDQNVDGLVFATLQQNSWLDNMRNGWA